MGGMLMRPQLQKTSAIAPEPSPALSRLIQALAQVAVNEYLTEEAALRCGSSGPRSNPVPLPDTEKAA